MDIIVVKKNKRGSQKKPLMVTIGAGVDKKATKRNLFKRRVRAIMRHHIGAGKNDFHIIARSGATKLSFQELREKIENKL